MTSVGSFIDNNPKTTAAILLSPAIAYIVGKLADPLIDLIKGGKKKGKKKDVKEGVEGTDAEGVAVFKTSGNPIGKTLDESIVDMLLPTAGSVAGAMLGRGVASEYLPKGNLGEFGTGMASAIGGMIGGTVGHELNKLLDDDEEDEPLLAVESTSKDKKESVAKRDFDEFRRWVKKNPDKCY